MVTVRVGSNPIQVRIGEQTSLASSMAAAAAVEADAAALSAATAEAASGPTYASTAAGLAATTSGEAFAVDNGDGTVTVYLNSAGVAVEQRTLATTAALASTDPGKGAALVAFKQDGDGSVHRTSEAKLRETVTPQDFGAVGDGYAAATEHAGIEAALSALRNTDDAFFSKALALPTGTYFLTAPADLLQSYNKILGQPDAVIRGAAGEHVLRADGASFVLSNLSRFATYGGLDSIHAGTAGEIALLHYDELHLSVFTGTALYFQAGLTSSRLTRLTIEGIASSSGHAVHCDGGLNNNNTLADSDIFNVAGDVVRVENQANGWQIRNVHIEGRGQAGAAQYHIEAPIACHIIGGWSEASHEYLVRTTAQVDARAAGVILDGLVSIGSAYGGGGFVGSKFDTGTNRIVFGSNHWSEATTAPAHCFIYGVNQKLRTNDSTVWTRDTGASFQLTTPAKRTAGATRTLALTFNRPSDSASTSNQQVTSLRARVNFGAFNPSGTAVHGCIEWHIAVRGYGATISAPQITKVTEHDGYSAASVTATCTAGTPGATEVVVTIAVGGLHTTEAGFIQAEIEGLNSSYTEDGRFTLSVA